MSAAARMRASLYSSPPWLQGMSWDALALVLVFCVFSAINAVTAPESLAMHGGVIEIAIAGLVRVPVFLVSGVTMLVAAVIVLNAAGRAGRERISLAVLAAVVGCMVASVMRYVVGATPEADGASFVLKVFITWFAPAVALTAGCVLYLRARETRIRAGETALRGKVLDTNRLETRLRLLRAQIEPHFLFNSLSNIRRLCQSDAAHGRAVLAQLTRYLRAALPKIREDEATLADEIELLSDYAGVQRIRMGDRLQVTVDVAATLARASVPPMMLVTLVENAIKHGIEPMPEGGSVRVAAVRNGDLLVMTVADTGRGFVGASGSGVGLANIRSRLSALYGAAAELRLEANQPRGVMATITLPWQPGKEGS